MKISEEKLRILIRESIRQNLIEEGFFDDAKEWIGNKFSSLSDFFSEFFSNYSKELSKMSSDIIEDLKKSSSVYIKEMIKSEGDQQTISSLIQYFATQEDIKDFLKEYAKKPESIDKLFSYLSKKGVNIESLCAKVAGKLIESGILEIDMSNSASPVYITDKKSAPKIISNALLGSMEELDAKFGIDFFNIKNKKAKKIKIGANIEKVGTKSVLKMKLKKMFKDS
jgi:hypothetical protein